MSEPELWSFWRSWVWQGCVASGLRLPALGPQRQMMEMLFAPPFSSCYTLVFASTAVFQNSLCHHSQRSIRAIGRTESFKAVLAIPTTTAKWRSGCLVNPAWGLNQHLKSTEAGMGRPCFGDSLFCSPGDGESSRCKGNRKGSTCI